METWAASSKHWLILRDNLPNLSPLAQGSRPGAVWWCPRCEINFSWIEWLPSHFFDQNPQQETKGAGHILVYHGKTLRLCLNYLPVLPPVGAVNWAPSIDPWAEIETILWQAQGKPFCVSSLKIDQNATEHISEKGLFCCKCLFVNVCHLTLSHYDCQTHYPLFLLVLHNTQAHKCLLCCRKHVTQLLYKDLLFGFKAKLQNS